MSRFLVGGAMAVVLCAVISAACNRDRETVQAANGPIGVQTGQMFVTVENRAGTPLLDLQVLITTTGGPQYSHLISRMEGAESRDVSLNDFVGRDGTTFSLRMMHPRTVRVTAKDLTNKSYEVETAWR
jgi:hypothetical protein